MRAAQRGARCCGFPIGLGERWSESNLYYYKARLYSPALGRFLQTDPVGNDAGPNLYEYVQDDPLNHTDPTGKLPDWGDIADALETVNDVLMANPEIGGPVEAVPVRMLARGAEALEGGTAASREARAAQLARNVAQGAKAEEGTAAKLGDKVAGRQVSFKTSDGTPTRADFVTKEKGVVETKSGGAQLSKGQQKLSNDIAAGRPVTPVGKNAQAAGLEPGKPTRMTSCQIDRPC